MSKKISTKKIAKATSKKTVAKKVAPAKKASKPVAKKPLAKKAVAKPAVKKIEKKKAQKTVSKAVSKTSLKQSPKKPVAKKVAPAKKASKTVAKKSVAKKPVAKKIEKKPAPKATLKAVKKPIQKVKPAANQPKKILSSKSQKKPAPKKTTKTEVKNVSVAIKNSSSKASKKAIKIEIKPAIEEKPLPEVEVVVPQEETLEIHEQKKRASDSIAFTMEDLDAYLEMRKAGNVSQQSKSIKTEASTKAVVKTVQPKLMKPSSSPQKPVAAASIFDILGFNPIEAPTLEKHEERDIPRKWKKYYNKLISLRKHHASGAQNISEEVLKRSAKEDSGDLSSYGQHLADAGSESFERDMAYNLLSNQKEILAEIDAAIARIKNGTYGVCEITGEQIPATRLEAIPFTRYTKEGQEIKEIENKRIRSAQRAIYDMPDVSEGNNEEEEQA